MSESGDLPQSNVVEFTGRRKDQELKKTIYSVMENMQTMLEGLNESYKLVDTMECEFEEVQQAYDALLEQYANVVGSGNLPIEMLEYSANLEVLIDSSGEWTIQWKKPE